MGRIKDGLTDIKTYLILGIFVLAFVANFMGFLDLPRRVKLTETASAENRKSVDKLADTVDDYILEQKRVRVSNSELRKQQMIAHEKQHEEAYKREALLTSLIMEVRSEGNHHD